MPGPSDTPAVQVGGAGEIVQGLLGVEQLQLGRFQGGAGALPVRQTGQDLDLADPVALLDQNLRHPAAGGEGQPAVLKGEDVPLGDDNFWADNPHSCHS